LLAIRLTRKGAKKQPIYRVIVTEKKTKRDGRFVEIVGHYNPCRQPVEIVLDRERIDFWIARGAKPSETVRSLLRRHQESVAAAAPADVRAA
jgi:small subunit ribosomal protein S16